MFVSKRLYLLIHTLIPKQLDMFWYQFFSILNIKKTKKKTKNKTDNDMNDNLLIFDTI